MLFRLFAVLILFTLPIFTFSQARQDLGTTLETYRQQANAFLKEMSSVRKTPLTGRVTSVEKKLTPQQLSGAVASFNKAWDTNALLLFYFHDGRALQLFVVNETTVIDSGTVDISKDSLLEVETNIRQSLGVYTNLSINRGSNSRGIGLHPTVQKGDSLYLRSVTELLIPARLAESLPGYSHLLVCPTLNLYSFPFAALRPFADNRYLGKMMPISILPNLYEFVAKTYTASPATFRSQVRKATVVGGPVFNSYIKPEDYYGRNKTIHEFFLEELPYTLEQTTAVKNLLLEDSTGRISIDFLQGTEATLTNVHRSITSADLVYIATHAFSASIHPWDSSFIAFAREATNKEPGENFWTSRAIYNNVFKAKLAVLSACQTGTGQLWNAGILSLGNSFYYAGVERVVSTLWNIDDQTTSIYMRAFMKALLAEGTKHPAYYLHMIQKTTQFSPRHWAGFICFGM